MVNESHELTSNCLVAQRFGAKGSPRTLDCRKSIGEENDLLKNRKRWTETNGILFITVVAEIRERR